MSISLLSHNGSDYTEVSDILIYHLKIDSSLSIMGIGKQERENFIGILKNLTIDENTIIYRQQTLKNFIESPNLLDELEIEFIKFTNILDTHQAEKRALHRSRSVSFNEKSGNESRDVLQMCALTTKKILVSLQMLCQLLKKHSLKADSLINLQNRICDIVENEAYVNLLKVCSFFEYFSLKGNLNCRLKLNDGGKISKCELIKRKYVVINNPELFRKGLFKKKRTLIDEKDRSIKVNKFIGTISEKLMYASIIDIASLLESFVQNIRSDYYEIFKETRFYKVALIYYQYINRLGGPITFPECSGEVSQNIEDLYDLHLVTQTENINKVVPYRLVLKKNKSGMIIIGDNGVGKTTLLRALGTMHLFYQAGLPILASDAKIKIHNCILSYYAKNEVFSKDKIGRFEQEVLEVKCLINKISQNSIILLNEVFQSTSYEEGSRALSDVLNFLTNMDITWILVTHMPNIIQYLPQNNIEIVLLDKEYNVNSK